MAPIFKNKFESNSLICIPPPPPLSKKKVQLLFVKTNKA